MRNSILVTCKKGLPCSSDAARKRLARKAALVNKRRRRLYQTMQGKKLCKKTSDSVDYQFESQESIFCRELGVCVADSKQCCVADGRRCYNRTAYQKRKLSYKLPNCNVVGSAAERNRSLRRIWYQKRKLSGISHGMMTDKMCEMTKRRCRESSNSTGAANREPSNSTGSHCGADFLSHVHRLMGTSGTLKGDEGLDFLVDKIDDDHVNQMMCNLEQTDKEERHSRNDPNDLRAKVCVVCDCIILGTEKVHYLDADTLVSQVDKLGIAAYQEHFGFDSLNPMLISQYRVHFCKIKIFVKS